LTDSDVKVELTVDVMTSALKHGVTMTEIEHCWAHAIRLVEYDYGGEDRLLVIGPSPSGQLLELVAVPPTQPERILHADRLRPKFYDYLR
jgi:uncharacterized DUF497 family protein